MNSHVDLHGRAAIIRNEPASLEALADPFMSKREKRLHHHEADVAALEPAATKDSSR